jgi:hypothetical protein
MPEFNDKTEKLKAKILIYSLNDPKNLRKYHHDPKNPRKYPILK